MTTTDVLARIGTAPFGRPVTRGSTLLAHLLPKLTSRGEDTATEALAFILNKSEACRRAVDSLVGEQDFAPGPVGRFETQVTFYDGSRPDMVGYDAENRPRLLVESKFWAALGEGQASRYLGLLEEPGPGCLMFVAPGSRVETLWREISRQVEAGAHPVHLEPDRAGDGMRGARAAGSGNRLVLVGWDLLLERLTAVVPADSPAASDLHQLRGYVEEQDLEAFRPLLSEELGPSLARRVLSLERLINDAVARGDGEDWISDGENVKHEEMCFGRYFMLPDGGDCSLWLGADFWSWARRADTPLWFWSDSGSPSTASRLRELADPFDVFEEDGELFVPIRLPVGVEYHRVLYSVEGKLREIAEIVRI